MLSASFQMFVKLGIEHDFLVCSFPFDASSVSDPIDNDVARLLESIPIFDFIVFGDVDETVLLFHISSKNKREPDAPTPDDHYLFLSVRHILHGFFQPFDNPDRHRDSCKVKILDDTDGFHEDDIDTEKERNVEI